MLLTIQDVVRRTGFSRQAIHTRCLHGKIEAQQDDDGRWLIKPSEIEKLTSRLVEPLYSPRETAALLSFSEQVITGFLRQGELEGMENCPFPNAVKIFSRWRIPEGDLLKLMRDSRNEIAPQAEDLLKEARAARSFSAAE